LQNFTFVIRHISGQSNKLVVALSKVNLILHEFQVNVLRFDELKEMYKDDAKFKYVYATCENPLRRDTITWLDYMIQDILVFKANKLCILRCSMRENLLKENHRGGLSEHFGKDKTFCKLSSFYFWPSMQAEVK
jgi:hypothetical protein